MDAPGIRLVARTSQSARKWDLPDELITVGRDPACDVVLEHETVSRRHARIVWDGAAYRLSDLGSVSGTAVNGRAAERDQTLRAGDVVAFGRAEVVFHASEGRGDATMLIPAGVRSERVVTAEVPKGGAALLVVQGEARGSALNLSGEAIVIGRDESCAVRVPDRYLSRKHATIEKKAGTFVLTDLGSSNGTFLNGRLVRQATLAPGDEIKIGSTVFRFRVEGESEAFRGLSGRADLFPLIEVLQLLQITGRTGTLHVASAKGPGRIRFEAGEIIHAAAGGSSGEEAACAIAAWVEGEFRFEPGGDADERTVAPEARVFEKAARAAERARRTK